MYDIYLQTPFPKKEINEKEKCYEHSYKSKRKNG